MIVKESRELSAFSECARIRHGSVRIPRRTSQQSKGDGTAPPVVLDRSQPLEKLVVIFRDNDPTEDIAMAAKIFRGRMHDEIGCRDRTAAE